MCKDTRNLKTDFSSYQIPHTNSVNRLLPVAVHNLSTVLTTDNTSLEQIELRSSSDQSAESKTQNNPIFKAITKSPITASSISLPGQIKKISSFSFNPILETSKTTGALPNVHALQTPASYCGSSSTITKSASLIQLNKTATNSLSIKQFNISEKKISPLSLDINPSSLSKSLEKVQSIQPQVTPTIELEVRPSSPDLEDVLKDIEYTFFNRFNTPKNQTAQQYISPTPLQSSNDQLQYSMKSPNDVVSLSTTDSNSEPKTPNIDASFDLPNNSYSMPFDEIQNQQLQPLLNQTTTIIKPISRHKSKFSSIYSSKSDSSPFGKWAKPYLAASTEQLKSKKTISDQPFSISSDCNIEVNFDFTRYDYSGKEKTSTQLRNDLIYKNYQETYPEHYNSQKALDHTMIAMPITEDSQIEATGVGWNCPCWIWGVYDSYCIIS